VNTTVQGYLLQGFEQRGRGAGLALEALSIDGEAPEHHLPKGSAVLESDDLPLGYPLKGCEPRRPGAGGAVHRRRGARAPPAQGLRRAGERRPALEQGPQGAPLAPGQAQARAANATASVSVSGSGDALDDAGVLQEQGQPARRVQGGRLPICWAAAAAGSPQPGERTQGAYAPAA